MTLDPVLQSGPVIALHTGAALTAFAAGPVAILRRQRDMVHKTAGYLWVGAMVVTALTALGIFELRLIGPLSPIHALVVVTLIMLWRGVAAIRGRRVVDHARTMVQLYLYAMGVAGLFTLLPGRRMNAVLFGGDSWAGFGLAAMAFAALAWWLWNAQPPVRRG
ncbi:MAG: DUF2306 domain-containing protein [Gemmobacter sp.]